MKLDLNKNLLGFDGKELLEKGFPVKLSILLSSYMSQGVDSVDTIKVYDWCLELTKKGSVEIDRSDKEKIHKFVDGYKQAPILVRGQILVELNNLKEDA